MGHQCSQEYRQLRTTRSAILCRRQQHSGYKLVEGELMMFHEEIGADMGLPDDERTAKIAQQIASDICDSIKMEVDYPNRHPSGWMLLLYLQVKIADDNTVDFMFYQKPMASPFTISSRAAIRAKVKLENNVQQGVRRLRNTRPRLHDVVRKNLKEEWDESMMVSGYPENYRRKADSAQFWDMRRCLTRVETVLSLSTDQENVKR